MKFVAIADTHGQHDLLELPAGDVLIHAGDMTTRGYRHEVESFLTWMEHQDYTYKILIAGNHDFFFERETAENIHAIIPSNIIYLENSMVTINNIKIWGSPITPWFYDWAFNKNRGKEISAYWDQIPQGVDIVVTHGPAYNILDKTFSGQNVGCQDLLGKIIEVKPKVHICGHIHEGYGAITIDETRFINASVLNERYIMKNKPIVFELS